MINTAGNDLMDTTFVWLLMNGHYHKVILSVLLWHYFGIGKYMQSFTQFLAVSQSVCAVL